MYWRSLLQSFTTQALDVLQQIAHAIDRPLSPWFTEITAQGIGVHFVMEHNTNWLVHTRPIVEAFLHAKYFVEMMVKYGRTMDGAEIMSFFLRCGKVILVFGPCEDVRQANAIIALAQKPVVARQNAQNLRFRRFQNGLRHTQ